MSLYDARLAEWRERLTAIKADASTRRQVEFLVSWLRDEPYLIDCLLAEVERMRAENAATRAVVEAARDVDTVNVNVVIGPPGARLQRRALTALNDALAALDGDGGTE